jgi:hypothetical protein
LTYTVKYLQKSNTGKLRQISKDDIPMKIALIADPHLSDITTVPQEESLNWALDTISQLSPAACLWLGDITACGAEEAAVRFLNRVKGLPFPSVIVPGNSDLRTAATANALERILHTHLKGLTLGDLTIVGMNTSHNTIAPEERNRLSGLADEMSSYFRRLKQQREEHL